VEHHRGVDSFCNWLAVVVAQEAKVTQLVWFVRRRARHQHSLSSPNDIASMKTHIALLLPLLLSMTLQAQQPADDERVVALLSGKKNPGDEEIIASLGIDSLEFLLTRLKGEQAQNKVPIYSRLIGLKYRQFSKDLTSEKKTEIMTTLCAKIGAIKDEGITASLIQGSLWQLQGINHPAVLQLIDTYLKSDVEWTRKAAQFLKDSLKSTTMEPEEDAPPLASSATVPNPPRVVQPTAPEKTTEQKSATSAPW